MTRLAVHLGPARCVSITGPDAVRFAAGMFTSDVKALTVGESHRSACCGPKGRLQGLMDLLRVDEHTLLAVLEGREVDDFIGHYERYLLMDDARLADASDGRAHLWIEGEVETEELSWPRRRAGKDGTDVLAADGNRYGPFDPVAFEQARIAAGDVRWPEDMSSKQLVHELGLRDEVLFFGKGCYLGQETINRLDVRGGVKQRLVALLLDGPASPRTEVYAGDKRVGVLRSTVEHTEHGWIGLCVVRMPHDEPGTTLKVGERSARVAELPL